MRFVGAFGAFADAVKRKCDSYVMGYNTIIGRVRGAVDKVGWAGTGLGVDDVCSVVFGVVFGDLPQIRLMLLLLLFLIKFEMIRFVVCCLCTFENGKKEKCV